MATANRIVTNSNANRARNITMLMFAMGVGISSWLLRINNGVSRKDLMGHSADASSDTRPLPEFQGAPTDEPTRAPIARFAVDVNIASWEELALLPGIGPGLSKRIVEYRHATGTFSAADELLNVPGIGPKRLSDILPYLLISSQADL